MRLRNFHRGLSHRPIALQDLHLQAHRHQLGRRLHKRTVQLVRSSCQEQARSKGYPVLHWSGLPIGLCSYPIQRLLAVWCFHLAILSWEPLAIGRLSQLRSKGYKNIKTQERYKYVIKYVLNVKIPAIQQKLLLNLFKEKFQGPLPKPVACAASE